jgi:hypothetical protein
MLSRDPNPTRGEARNGSDGAAARAPGASMWESLHRRRLSLFSNAAAQLAVPPAPAGSRSGAVVRSGPSSPQVASMPAQAPLSRLEEGLELPAPLVAMASMECRQGGSH